MIMYNTNQLQQFRQEIYQTFSYRSDSLMDLIDSLSSNNRARSVVQLSLNSCFRRQYSSISDAIDNFFVPTLLGNSSQERKEYSKEFLRIIAKYLREPKERNYWLFGIDATSQPRLFSPTLADRGFVYHPTQIKGNKPITIGHKYSVLVCLPQKETPHSPAWVVPLSTCRIKSTQSDQQVALEQTQMLLKDQRFTQKLCVEVADSKYSCVEYLAPMVKEPNLVIVSRLRGSRTLYRPPQQQLEAKNPRGHPTWYGQRFSLKEPDTWGQADNTIKTSYKSRRQKTYTVVLQSWKNLLMRGKKDLPMHQNPFTVVRVQLFNQEAKAVYKRPMWLIVIGQRADEISLLEVWQAYQQRFDIEHFFRFGKQKLLLSALQTPDVEHEENWWQIAQLAYMQLFLGRFLAQAMPNPWERHLPRAKSCALSPTDVQRDFQRIIGHIGTPAKVPKPRGKSPGRQKGYSLGLRERFKVVKKTSEKVKER